MASASVCEPCSRDDETRTASKVCTDCEERLCEECARSHRRYKAFASHHLVDIGAVSESSILVQKHFCQLHPEETPDYFCTQHDVLCCRSCMAGTHRLCEAILPIEVAAKNVEKSTMFEETVKEFSSIIKGLETLDQEQAASKKNLGKQSDEIATKISILKAAILKKVNDMEKQTITQLETLKREQLKAIDSNRTGIKSLKELTSKCLAEIDFTVKNGSHKQIFLLLQSLKHQVREQGEHVENMTSTFKTTSLTFNSRDNVIPTDDDFGEIVVSRVPSDVVFNPDKHRQGQAQVLPREKSLLQFKYENKIPTVMSVRSIVMPEDDQIILCPYDHGEKLYICDKNGKNENTVLVEGTPYRLALIPGQDMVVVVIHGLSKSKLQFIDTKSLKAVKTVNLESHFYGVTATKSNIYLGGDRCIEVLDTNAKYLRRIKLSESGKVEYLYIGQNEKMYVSIYNLNALLCLEQDGTIVFRYQPKDKRFWPNDIRTDLNGNVYVVNNANDDVHRLSPDGEFIDVIATKDDNVWLPWTCCFNKNFTKLYLPTSKVNNCKGGTLIFSCK